MKYITILLMAFALLTSCKNESSVRDAAPTVNPAAPAAPAPATVNIVGGAHYVCTLTGCAGVGASGAGSCEVCGNALAHNQGFHTNQTAQPNTANEGLSPLFTNPQQSAASSGTNAAGTPPALTTTPTTPEPAQNANGVWHYTCSNGCAGGAGSALACATCGTTLAHNQGYH